MRFATLLLLLALPLVAQDPKPLTPPDISNLVHDLGSDDVLTRENATKSLIELGETILSELQKLEQHSDVEVASRAHKIISAILRNKELVKYYNPCKPITMEFDGKGEDFLKKLTGLTDLKFSHSIDTRNVKLSLKDATVLQTLDLLCYKLRDVRWRFSFTDGVVEFIKEWDSYESPAFYNGPFKISVPRVEVFRSTYFKNEVGGLILHLASQVDHTTKPTGRVDFSLQEVMDDVNQLSENPVDPDQLLLINQLNRLYASQIQDPNKVFYLVGLTKGSKRLKKVRGLVGYYFPLITKKVVIDNLTAGQRVDADSFTINIVTVDSNSFKMVISKDVGPTTMERHFNVDTLVATERGGARWTANNGSVSTDPQGNATTYIFYWYNGQTVSKVEFDLITEYQYIQFPFEINNIVLP